MDSNSLSLLVEILDAGSLSQAARRLEMTRANVSYHLNQIEREVGMQLVRRTTRRIQATEIGQRLYEYGRSIRNEVMAAHEAVDALRGTLSGRIRLSVPSGYGQMVMSPWLIDFKRRYPGIVLDVRFENRIADLLQEEIDIAVRVLSEPPQNLVARELGAVRYVVCASVGYARKHGMPQALEELRSLPLITSSVVGRQLRLSAYRGDARHEITLEPTLMSEHFPFLRESLLAGLGVGIVPDYLVQDVIATGHVLTAIDSWRLSIFGTQLFMLYMPDRHQTLAAKRLITFMLGRARSVARPA
jgi:DNA-binding transcriptional LysR family regulator